MLELKIKEKNEIDTAGKLVYLTDDTGAYNSTTNPTGYGSPNASRAQVAVFPIGVSINSKGVETPLSFVTYDPLSSTEWVAKIQQDGWLQFRLVYVLSIGQIPDFPDDYAAGTLLFSEADYKLIKIVATPTGNIVQDAKPEDIDGASSKPFDQFFVANTSFLKIDLNKRYTELLISSENLSNTVDLKEIGDRYDRVRAILTAAIYQFCIGNKYEAAKYIEFLITNNYGQLQQSKSTF